MSDESYYIAVQGIGAPDTLTVATQGFIWFDVEITVTPEYRQEGGGTGPAYVSYLLLVKVTYKSRVWKYNTALPIFEYEAIASVINMFQSIREAVRVRVRKLLLPEKKLKVTVRSIK